MSNLTGVMEIAKARSPISHLYVHIPFCPKICPYCSFYKEASDRNKTQAFLDAVLAELSLRHAETPLRPKTIFFGGGTPSALSTPQLQYLLGGIRERIPLDALEEWTLEMNPATVSAEKARALLDLGVNRVSMGVQSWNPELLKTLGRVHTAEQARRSYEILREVGVPNVNLDLIFSVPGQTLTQWEDSVRTTIALGPDHISCYCLTYEEDTDYFRRMISGEFVPDEETDATFFERTLAMLEDAGYAGYEISNFARPGRECLHNLAYWFGHEYIGLGPSAFSTVGPHRWQNIPDTAAYSAAILEGRSARKFEEHLSEATLRAETIAFSLRTNRGADVALLAPFQTQVSEFESLGLLERKEDRYLLTRSGRLLADSVAEAFV